MSKYVYFSGSSQHLLLNKYGVSTTDFWYLLAIAHTENPIFQQLSPYTPWYALRSISGDDSEKYPIFDFGNNTEYLQVMLSNLSILLNNKLSVKTSERRERAGSRKSRQLSKSTRIAVRLRAIDIQNFWLIKMQMTKWGVSGKCS